MNLKSLSAISALLVVVGSQAGCAGADNPDITDDRDSGFGADSHPLADTGSTPVDTSTGTDTAKPTDSGAPICIDKCSADLDCAGSCPAVAAGNTNCCDLATSVCYVAPSATCPAPPDFDAGPEGGY